MTIRMTKTMDTFCQRNAQRGHDYQEYGDDVNAYDEEEGDNEDDEDKDDDKDNDNDDDNDDDEDKDDDKDNDNDDDKVYLNRCAPVSTFHLEKEKQTFHFQPTGHDCQWKNMPLKKLKRNYMFFGKRFCIESHKSVKKAVKKRGSTTYRMSRKNYPSGIS